MIKHLWSAHSSWIPRAEPSLGSTSRSVRFVYPGGPWHPRRPAVAEAQVCKLRLSVCLYCMFAYLCAWGCANVYIYSAIIIFAYAWMVLLVWSESDHISFASDFNSTHQRATTLMEFTAIIAVRSGDWDQSTLISHSSWNRKWNLVDHWLCGVTMQIWLGGESCTLVTTMSWRQLKC